MGRNAKGKQIRQRGAFQSCNSEVQHTIPGTGLDPVGSVHECSSAPKTGVGCVNPFHVSVAALLKQLHQNCLHALGFVDDGFCAHLQPTNLGIGQVVTLHQPLNDGEAEAVDVFPVGAEPHAALAKPYSIL